MKSFVLFLLPLVAGATTFHAVGADPAPWSKIFGAVGIAQTANVNADILVAGPHAGFDPALADNHIVILEGASALAGGFGVHKTSKTVLVRRICDEHAPRMEIFWEKPLTIPIVQVPSGFRIFAADYWKHAPVIAGRRTAHGAILWLATKPGANGYERYPYLLNALADLGLKFPARSANLWAFFDSSYRLRADVYYLARRWRAAGIAALQVAAWHNMDPNPTRDAFLKRLIDACHRNGILVYAWFELPHVSDQFWADHPEWREKTALGQDAQLDWRKLMNLQNPDCRRAAAREVLALLSRFDWDGANLAELYFESLEGVSDPARFTPMDDNVRAEFKRIGGFDPKLLFDPSSPYSAANDPAGLRKFLDYRAGLTTRMQAQWLAILDRERAKKPYLDVVLTHIDDRFEPGIRDALGADVARTLPLLEARGDTLLVEDPATLWSLGPSRYAKLAQEYHKLAPHDKNIGVDINVVERYQDVYPTKKQTGVELMELVHQAAVSFSRVALYFEHSLESQDLGLLPVAATTATVTQKGTVEVVNARHPIRIAWKGPVKLDGRVWPIQNSHDVLVPAGKHTLTAGSAPASVTVSDFNGQIQSAEASRASTEIAYFSRSRAIAVLAAPVSCVEIDGTPLQNPDREGGAMLLPAGQHVVAFTK
ncbi:MAG TPA: hypothetical protein VF283_00570 [Bryobacteraceae bacterium]